MRILYVGLDVGKKRTVYWAFTELAEVFEGSLLTLDEQGWRSRFAAWQKEFQVRACYEVGPHYEWMHDLLREYCAQVEMINAAEFHVISKSQKKTDKNDARKLAEGLRRGDLPTVYVPEPRIRADRRLTHFMRFQSRQLARVKGRLRSLLLSWRLDCPHSDVLGVKAQEWCLREARPRMDRHAQLFLEMLLEQARLLAKYQAQLGEELPARLAAYGPDSEIVDSIPGFGPLVTLAVLAAVAGIERFNEPKELAAYFGVCGRVHQSGEHLRLGSLTKRGSPTVRWLLSQAVTHVLRKDPKVRKRYLKLKRKKGAGVARAAEANWLVRLVFLLLKRRELYRLPKARQAAA